MADAALKVVIGAETQGAVTGIKAVEFTLRDCSKALKELKENRFEITDNKELLASNRMISDLTENIKKLERAGTKGFDDFGNAIAKTSSPLQTAYSDVRKLANILPGIGIGGLIAVGFEVLAQALEGLLPSLLNVDKAQALLNKEMADGIGKVAGESLALKDLVGIATDQANSVDLRRKALAKLQEEYPNAFKNMSIEKTSVGELTAVYDKLSAALVRQAQIKGIEAAISKVSAEQAELLAGSMTDVIKAAGVFGSLKAIFTNDISKLVSEPLTDSQEKINKLNDALKNLLKTSLTEGDETLLSKTLAKPIKVKVQPVIEENDPQHSAIRLGTFLDTSRFSEDFKVLQGKIDKHPMNLIFRADIKAQMELFEDAARIAAEVNKIFETEISRGFADLGESIGAALAAGENPIKAAGNSILATVGDLIEQIGKALVEYGIVKEGLDKIIEGGIAIPGAVALAAGVAALALGGLVKGLSHQHKFAEGGIVTGPTNALIGEAGPEVVFPLEKLNNFVKNRTGAGNMNINVAGVISGNDLQLVLARNSKNQSYV